MASYYRKYGVTLTGGTAISIPMIKAGFADFATNSDWTPVAGDVLVSTDDGTEANIGTLPTYTNGAWKFVLTGTNLTGKRCRVRIVDSPTKAVEDNFFDVETFGDANALLVFDLGTAMSAQAVASVTGAVGSVTGNVGGNVVGSVASVTGAVGSVTGNVGGNVVGSTASVTGAVGSVTGSVGSVTGAVGSVTGNVGGNVTGSVGSVVGSVASVTGAVGSVTGAVGSVTGNVGGNVVGSVASVTGNVGGNVNGSVASVTTVNDKTGYSLSATGLDLVTATATGVIEIAKAIWDRARSSHTTTGTFGQGVASVQGNVTGSVASVTGAVGSLTVNNDKTGYALSAAGVDDIWDEPITEPTGIWSWASATPRKIVGWMGALARNKIIQTTTTQTLRNDADNATIATFTASEAGGTATRGEWT